MSAHERFSELDMIKSLFPYIFSLQNLASSMAKYCSDIFGADICSIWLVYDRPDGNSKLVLAGYHGFREEVPNWEETPSYDLPWGEKDDNKICGLTPWVAVRSKAYLAASYPELKAHPSHTGKWDNKVFEGHADTGFSCLMAVPLIHRKNILGVLKLENRKSNQRIWSSKDEALLCKSISPTASSLLSESIRHEKEDMRLQSALNNIAQQFLQPIDNPNILYQKIVDTAAEILQAKICSLWIADRQMKFLRLGAAKGVKNWAAGSEKYSKELPVYTLDWNEADDAKIQGITAWVAIRQRPYSANTYNELKKHPSHNGKWDKRQFDSDAEHRFKCLHAEPLISGGRTIGVFKVENKKGRQPFTDADKSVCSLLSQFLALALEQKGRLGDMAFDFFHLLKEPITNVLTVYQVLRKDLEPIITSNARIKNWLDLTKRNLINLDSWSTLAYALGNISSNEGEASAILICDIFNDVITRLKYTSEDVDYDCNPEAGKYALWLTENQQKMVFVIFFNIMHNSVKSVADIDRRGRITLAVEKRHEDSLVISISDNGCGISKEDLPHVFETGFSRKQPKFPDPTGIGLSTVARLVADFRWGMDLESRKGEGTVFLLRLKKGDWKEVG